MRNVPIKILISIALLLFFPGMARAGYFWSVSKCETLTAKSTTVENSNCIAELKRGDYCCFDGDMSCSWKKGRLSLSLEQRCQAYEMHPAASNDKCATSTKPIIDTLSASSYQAVCCCPTRQNAIVKKEEKPKFVMPELQISIPGLKFTSSSSVKYVANRDGSYYVEIPWLSEYMAAVYNYGLAIAGILAAIVLMGGGVIWLVSGGDASKISQAKELIIGSITGLVILFSSYVILFQVNPDLLKFKPITIGMIKESEFGGDNSNPGTPLDIEKISTALGVTCGQDSVAEIFAKSKGKVTYSQDFKRQSAPNGYVYFDCSSFASFALKCAKGKNTDSYSGDIFKDGSLKEWDKNKLEVGDFVGWPPSKNPKQSGHVMVYLGEINGVKTFGDCHGGDNKQPGQCISNSMTIEKLESYTKSIDGKERATDKIYWRRY